MWTWVRVICRRLWNQAEFFVVPTISIILVTVSGLCTESTTILAKIVLYLCISVIIYELCLIEHGIWRLCGVIYVDIEKEVKEELRKKTLEMIDELDDVSDSK